MNRLYRPIVRNECTVCQRKITACKWKISIVSSTMLKCRDVPLQASDYLDHNQSLLQRLNMTMHLLICNKCKLFMRHLRTAVQYYQRRPFTEFDDVAATTIVERIVSKHVASPE